MAGKRGECPSLATPSPPPYNYVTSMKTTPSPNPTWKPKNKITLAKESPFVSLNPADMPAQDVYKIIIGSLVPRPIALISTVSKEGKGNLAPFSFFNGVSSNPPALMISISVRPDGTTKDTLRNIKDTNEFVVNSANRWIIEPLVHTAGEFPSEINEMEEVGLTPLASSIVIPPRVKESAIQFECTRYADIQIGDGTPGSSTVVVGQIVKIHIAEHLYQNGRIILSEHQPIGRLGGMAYTTIGDVFEIPVPKIR